MVMNAMHMKKLATCSKRGLNNMAQLPNMSPNKNPMPTQDAIARGKNFNEVALGYSE